MSSDPFVLLGLDRKTATDGDVRRAYAQRLKTTRPEDDRDGFMALRAAFERARQEVRWRNEYGDEDDEDEDWDEGRADDVADIVEDAPLPELTESHEPQDEPEEPEEPEPRDYPPDRAMDALVDTLTGSPFGVSRDRVMAIVEADEVGGIEEFQNLQWRVRSFLCDRSGFNLDTPELRRPDWLSLEVFDALDGYFGWTRQPPSQEWVRRQNDWMVRLRKRIIWEAMPEKERANLRSTAMERSGAIPDSPNAGKSQWSTESEGESGSLRWLFAGIGIIIYAIVQFVFRSGS